MRGSRNVTEKLTADALKELRANFSTFVFIDFFYLLSGRTETTKRNLSSPVTVFQGKTIHEVSNEEDINQTEGF